jgi:hypothetical protein
VVFDQEIKKMGRLALEGGISLLAPEALIDRPNRPFEQAFGAFPPEEVARLAERKLVNQVAALLVT